MQTHSATPSPADPPPLVVRRLMVDLAAGFDRHWHGGDAFRSQYYNALSMSFPVGEQSFIDAVRACVALLPETAEHDALRATVAGFIGQEATHRHLHHLYNLQLERQGLVNRWQHWAAGRLKIARDRNIRPIHLLAVTAAYEHCTAVFADGALRYANWFDGADPRLQLLWRWHAAEESEHRAVAFDLYQTLSGHHGWRIRWYVYVLVLFGLDSLRQTLLNLWHDGSLFRPATWWGAATFFWGRNGMVWRCTLPLLAYFGRDFHPDRHGDKALAERWLAEHSSQWRAVRRDAAA